MIFSVSGSFWTRRLKICLISSDVAAMGMGKWESGSGLFYFEKKLDKVVELVGGGPVINEAHPV